MKYVHTNINARDWRKLADFYIEVFGCKKVSVKRKLNGKWFDKGTGIEDVDVEGVHLLLPGHGENGPTLEIYQYNKFDDQELKMINRDGFGHIAFQVDNVEETLNAVIKAGGGKLSEIVQQDIPELGTLTFVYANDPEGNYVGLQKFT